MVELGLNPGEESLDAMLRFCAGTQKPWHAGNIMKTFLDMNVPLRESHFVHYLFSGKAIKYHWLWERHIGKMRLFMKQGAQPLTLEIARGFLQFYQRLYHADSDYIVEHVIRVQKELTNNGAQLDRPYLQLLLRVLTTAGLQGSHASKLAASDQVMEAINQGAAQDPPVWPSIEEVHGVLRLAAAHTSTQESAFELYSQVSDKWAAQNLLLRPNEDTYAIVCALACDEMQHKQAEKALLDMAKAGLVPEKEQCIDMFHRANAMLRFALFDRDESVCDWVKRYDASSSQE